MIAYPDMMGYPPFVVQNANVTPSAIASMLRWYRASSFDGVAHGTEVTTWPDLAPSGCALHAVNTSGTRPTVALRSTPTNGTSVNQATLKYGLTSAYASGVGGVTLTSSSTWTIFLVIKVNTAANTRAGVFGFNPVNTDGMALEFMPDGRVSIYYPNVGQWATTSIVLPVGRWGAILVSNDAGTESVWGNGTFYPWASQPGTMAGTTTAMQLFVGYQADLTNYTGDVNIAECILFNAAVSAVEREILFAYARDRYGL